MLTSLEALSQLMCWTATDVLNLNYYLGITTGLECLKKSRISWRKLRNNYLSISKEELYMVTHILTQASEMRFAVLIQSDNDHFLSWSYFTFLFENLQGVLKCLYLLLSGRYEVKSSTGIARKSRLTWCYD